MKEERLTRYHAHLDFTEPILGSWPTEDYILREHIQKKAGEILNQEMVDEELAALPADELKERLQEMRTTVFPRDKGDGHIILWNYQVLGFLKEMANDFKKAMGVTNFRWKIATYCIVDPRRFPLLRDGQPIMKPDDIFVRPLRRDSKMGPIVAISTSERLYPPLTLDFDLCCLHNQANWSESLITEEMLRDLLDLGVFKGLGQWHSGGWGRFEYTLEQVGVNRTETAERC